MELIYLSRADVEELGLTMKEVLEAVDNGFRLKGLKKTEMPPKPGVHPRPNAFIHAMPGYVQEVEAAGLKWVSGYPANPQKGLPYITGLLVMNDPDTGVPIAVMDCAWITAMRTGASVGISAKYLARPNSSTAGILGCGVQARTSLAALVETLSALRIVRCYDLYPEAAKRFIDEMKAAFPALEFVTCNSPAEMMEGAEVVVSAIPILEEPEPPLEAGMLQKGGLAVSLDYDAAWTSAAMKECEKFASDDIGQLLYTKKEGVHFGGIPESIYADLGELSAGLKPGRENAEERIFSMNMGIAVDDMVTANILYARAVESGAGTKLEL
ncbi:MAG: ornithine cyclodeaminase family protein [Armatimonadetes bacterium]|nr:ornithine cyclodeaminase family protein [Armatimonadota bacterium]NIM23919.1 ornithine cyclodeaminase family protein [Armatimonadota bacterium]NIM66638.1 ornithine cyclodeaminase family protein [Armatimonadota bacterium]NIM76306.1 ornithine cyclodeaminase family protein [Armatimonadota bacterium]NIN06000.1 ornithine cyclodeaminase family protein [Armatimonadota bacterium]